MFLNAQTTSACLRLSAGLSLKGLPVNPSTQLSNSVGCGSGFISFKPKYKPIPINAPNYDLVFLNHFCFPLLIPIKKLIIPINLGEQQRTSKKEYFNHPYAVTNPRHPIIK